MNNEKYVSYRNKIKDHINTIQNNPTAYYSEQLDLIKHFEGKKEKKKRIVNPISGYAKVASKRFLNDLENIKFENLSKKQKIFAGTLFSSLSLCSFLAIGNYFTGLETGVDKLTHMAIGAFATPSLYSLTTFAATTVANIKNEFGRLFRESGIIPYFFKNDNEKEIHNKIDKYFSVESNISKKILDEKDKSNSVFNIIKNSYEDELLNLAYKKNKKPSKEFLTVLRDNIFIIEKEFKFLENNRNESKYKRKSKKNTNRS